MKDKNGKTPLHYAVELKNLESLVFLAEKGADLQAKDKNGRSPIQYGSEMEK